MTCSIFLCNLRKPRTGRAWAGTCHTSRSTRQLFTRAQSLCEHCSRNRQRYGRSRIGNSNLLKGLSLFALGGATLKTAGTPEHREYFSEQVYPNSRIFSYPQVHGVSLTTVPIHLVRDAKFGPYGINEMLYAKEFLASTPDDSLTAFDKGFCRPKSRVADHKRHQPPMDCTRSSTRAESTIRSMHCCALGCPVSVGHGAKACMRSVRLQYRSDCSPPYRAELKYPP